MSFWIKKVPIFAILLWPIGAACLTLNIQADASLDVNLKLSKVTESWGAIFSDPVDVNVRVIFEDLGPNCMAKTVSAHVKIDFLEYKSYLKFDKKTRFDSAFIRRLPVGGYFSRLINGGGETFRKQYSGHVQDGINSIEITRANAKAIGFINSASREEDALIIINSSLLNERSIESSKLNAVFFHELGHVFGFVSGVDMLDSLHFFKGNVLTDDDSTSYVAPLDFFRCSLISRYQNADIDWTIGRRPKDFSLDEHCSLPLKIENAWSTGAYMGDKFEASHWRVNSGLGLMEPVYKNTLVISHLERVVFDVIGWDLR